jgi:hypothetical protein
VSTLTPEKKKYTNATFTKRVDHEAGRHRTLRAERARSETERASHYFKARLSEQFDVVIHFDQTRAVEALDLTAEWETGEVPETFPTGILKEISS